MDLAQLRQFLFSIMLLFFALHSKAQTPNYDTLWKEVNDLNAKGLPKSALKQVQAIESKATLDKNDTQLVKTLLFKSKYALVLEEEAQLKIINDFKTKISKSNFPVKNILENMLANLYWQYFKTNRRKFYKRTKTSEKVNAEDFRTWDLETLFLEVHTHYQNALKNGLLLQMEPLANYSVLLKEQKDSKIYRPTLYDFLSYNALQFYKTSETHITKPAYRFEINQPDFFNDAESFSKIQLQTKDSTALQFHALKIYKNLIRFHLRNRNNTALTDANLNRLKFVHSNTTLTNKQTLLLEALDKERKNTSNATAALYDFEIAKIYFKQSKAYVAERDDTHRWKAQKALELCKTVIENYPKSYAATKCKLLQSKITQTYLEITTETVIPIQQESRLLIRYKNAKQLHLKSYKLSTAQLLKFNKAYNQEDKEAFLKKLKTVHSWEYPLKNENDYQQHSTEVVVPKHNNGHYVITASTAQDAHSNIAFATLQVTNLALVEGDTQTHKTFQIIDRINGTPIENAKVKISYNSPGKKQIHHETYATSTLGTIKLPKSDIDRRNNLKLDVSYVNDQAHFGNYYLNRRYKNAKKRTRYKAFIFTDRSIYRPGQTLYFKAIALVTDSNNTSKVLENEGLQATLYNTNGESVKTLSLRSNPFGAVSGTFILPATGLNGIHRIEITSKTYALKTSYSFSVEDYKRPKFETNTLPVTETFKVNDTVTIKGNALAFSGNAITGAKVVYNVTRKVNYPRWYSWRRPYLYGRDSQNITFGETTTDALGNYQIAFKALPDASISKAGLPVFHYEIDIDVTDINGETRSTTTTVNIGYHALIANIEVATALDKTKKDHLIAIDTKNLNGEFTPSKGTLTVHKLIAPTSVLRPRPWPAPDYQQLSKEDFKKRFPHESYNTEHNPNSREKGAVVFKREFNTKTNKTIALGKLKKWESGFYRIVLETKDKFGQLVKDEVNTFLFSPKDATLADQQLFSISTDKTTYAIGETAIITVASAAKNLNVTLAIEKAKTIVKTEVIRLNNNKKTISIPVTANDVGGFAVHYSFAAFNSFKSGTEVIAIPYPKTDLEIETLTFRDKLKPGADETWQFKIKGPKGDKVNAELLASMYDASLDEFKTHKWNFNPLFRSTYNAYTHSHAHSNFGSKNFRVYGNNNSYFNYPRRNYDTWNWFGFNFGTNRQYIGSVELSRRRISNETEYFSVLKERREKSDLDAEPLKLRKAKALAAPLEQRDVEEGISTAAAAAVVSDTKKTQKKDLSAVKIRKNFQETAFFFPHLHTDTKGNVSFSFTTPEALTQWKLQLLAHTKSLQHNVSQLTTVTQKELMVIPNAPRFLRTGDQITISTKIASLVSKPLSGYAQLELTDAISGKDLTALFLSRASTPAQIDFSVKAKSNTKASWHITVPDTIQALQYKISAKSGNFSDGEQNVLPVLSNRILVTETLPMWVKSNSNKTFTLEQLKTNRSKSLKHHKLTLEVTSNPAWYAVQALPYVMEYPYECNEQTFSKYYANALARHIVNSNPKIKHVFEHWRSTDALVSNLEKNQDLKSILIQETPWLRDAQTETEQKKRIALLFDTNKMAYELQSATNKLSTNQLSSGAWPWFKGGYANRYITQHIIAGFGHLKQLNVPVDKTQDKMISKALLYLDAEFVKTYKAITRYNPKADLSKDHLNPIQLHYLYVRSFFPEVKTTRQVQDIIAYYQSQIKTYGLNRSLYAKGMMALINYRNGDVKGAAMFLNALKESSITSNELGMYWKSNTNSYYWHQAPIETQALLIEMFSEAGTLIQSAEKTIETIDNLKIWLLKHKQTNRWKTTKATTDAIYALLLQGNDWLSVTDKVAISLGKHKIDPALMENVKVEAGTGYYKTTWEGKEIQPELATVNISKTGKGIAWSSLYWQYFEDLDKISAAKTPLQLRKKLFLKTNTATGEHISEITDNSILKVGDLVRVRIELKTDRPMEFVHMKDMRAAGLEPVNVLSKYKWQDGLGYYESTKDTATNFFFDRLPKGVYVFEYDLRVNNAGVMSNGITTIQSMYAPEFSSHSKGSKIHVQ